MISFAFDNMFKCMYESEVLQWISFEHWDFSFWKQSLSLFPNQQFHDHILPFHNLEQLPPFYIINRGRAAQLLLELPMFFFFYFFFFLLLGNMPSCAWK